MQDPRLNLLSVLCLSIASFASVPAALLSLLWWGVHARTRAKVLFRRSFWMYLLLVAVIAVLIQVSGGEGWSYGIRILAIVFVASWAFGEYRSGSLMDIAVWALGNRKGFELGLVAEMSMQGLQVLTEDVDRLREAYRSKGSSLGWRTLPSAVYFLLTAMLSRADAQANLLAVRGYRHGGSLCPTFTRKPWDLVSTLSAIGILGLALMLATGEPVLLP